MNDKSVRLLRISYWVGAIADGAVVMLMLNPGLYRMLYGIPDIHPGNGYRYAMGLAASMMAGWTLLLIWADRRPVERRGVLALTIFVILALAATETYAVATGYIDFWRMAPTWIFQIFLAALFGFSLFKAKKVTVTFRDTHS